MAKEDIIGGLKTAILRGFSLKDAMISFYNAGYKKEEIEEAARELQYQMIENRQKSGNEKLWTEESKESGVPSSPQKMKEKQMETSGSQHAAQLVKPSEPELKPQNREIIPKPSQIQQQNKEQVLHVPQFKTLPKAGETEHALEEQKNQQKSQVSSYESFAPKVRSITFILIGILIILLGLLGAIFIFKDQIIEFFNNLF